MLFGTILPSNVFLLRQPFLFQVIARLQQSSLRLGRQSIFIAEAYDINLRL